MTTPVSTDKALAAIVVLGVMTGLVVAAAALFLFKLAGIC